MRPEAKEVLEEIKKHGWTIFVAVVFILGLFGLITNVAVLFRMLLGALFGFALLLNFGDKIKAVLEEWGLGKYAYSVFLFMMIMVAMAGYIYLAIVFIVLAIILVLQYYT